MDMYGFYTGQIFDAYEFLGAHLNMIDGSATFRTFAPAAAGICLLYGDQEIPMHKAYDGNFYEVTVSDASPDERYEYRIYRRDGNYTDHCDPYGTYMELRPDHKSILCAPLSYEFHDAEWMRQRTTCMDRPLNIYEMHLGSWRKPESGEWYRYEELAEPLAAYLTETGYNYVEFLPISEHPSDESWGYQNTGFFAPTSRYGKPEGLMQLIDTLHRHGIGVILDFVPVHFASDSYGLSLYDGSPLYEYPHPAVGVSEWGSCNFMHSRGEVRSFLQSAANYWLKEFHFDGLRMDAISNIIYWQGDAKRGVNGNAVDFLKVMNRGLKQLNPNCILFAEDSTNYQGTTTPVEYGGLGFDYKWDMGWMHDTLEYFQTPPAERTQHYHKLTFSMMYFRNECYLLPFSHDEVVHGKATIAQKMYGDYEMKFPQARAMYLYMAAHPGKKLNFMGSEIAQLREWDEKRQQDWSLRSYPIHDSFYRYMKDLNKIYLAHSALSEQDYSEDGFEWVDCHQEARCIYAIRRSSHDETLYALFNFSDQAQEYELALPQGSRPELILHTDWNIYNGDTAQEVQTVRPIEAETGRAYESAQESGTTHYLCTLPPFSGLLLKI